MIALMFRERFPENARIYMEAARAGEVRMGRMLVAPAGGPLPKWIIHFPTKKHWRNPSRPEWVREGLVDLVRVVREHGMRSIAVPALGCGAGGLDWRVVRPMMEDAFAELPDVHVMVYEPAEAYRSAPEKGV
jgi:O-acetyl-ADP-ribose deacetylase (regulator of RNase III)